MLNNGNKEQCARIIFVVKRVADRQEEKQNAHFIYPSKYLTNNCKQEQCALTFICCKRVDRQRGKS
jgi:hypothetical protein